MMQAAGRDHEDEDDFTVWEPVYFSPADSIAPVVADPADLSTAILGETIADARTMWLFVREHNADFPLEIAEAFHRLGAVYGIRADVALCQAIVETGWFKFGGGTSVTADQHNYCGLGVTRRGVKGHAFDCVEDGVRAQLQHLYAYASTKPLPEGEKMTDPRFGLVKRGIATTWHELSNRWAMNENYGRQIISLYEKILAKLGSK